ncbi:DUF2461 domain-containing protein [Pedobacter sp. B4-66]|uniref:DUF2461 domain-containing protein n=1 Tax=Pedobacter sp. B4-66 TaxID=2817280 RepID=UPI001BD9F81F|nr:DUF2461 domain-containing protein [Pedobacter sp. B4-66]
MAKLLKKPQIYNSSFEFLNQVKENNNREWFSLCKEEFQKEQGLIEDFAEALLKELNIDDVIETPSGKNSVYRIYRDTRFSKDKTPYKTYWSGSFRRATKYRRGGYYYHIEQGNSFIAGGFWGPSALDLKQVREHIAFDATPLREILTSDLFVATFKSLKGEQLKTTPKGFRSDHENIDLLRYKQFLLVRHFTDEEVLSEFFFEEAVKTFTNMRPFFDYMSEVLTTDINGIEV